MSITLKCDLSGLKQADSLGNTGVQRLKMVGIHNLATSLALLGKIQADDRVKSWRLHGHPRILDRPEKLWWKMSIGDTNLTPSEGGSDRDGIHKPRSACDL